MKFLVLFFTFNAISFGSYAYYSSDHPRSMNAGATYSRDQVDSRKAGTQEYIDTARTGQASTMRLYKADEDTCRDADGVWLSPEDKGYSACVRDAKAAHKVKRN